MRLRLHDRPGQPARLNARTLLGLFQWIIFTIFLLLLSDSGNAAGPLFVATNGKVEILLLASTHTPDTFSQETAATIRTLLPKSQRICLEGDRTAGFAAEEWLQRYAQQNPSLAAKNVLTDSNINEIRMLTKRYPWANASNIDRILALPPYFAAEILASLAPISGDPSPKAVALDDVVLDATQSRNLASCFLETVEMAYLPTTTVSIESSKAYLKFALRALNSERFRQKIRNHETQQLRRLFVERRLASFCRAESRYMASNGLMEVYDKSITSRNAGLVERLTHETENVESVFVAIGALHFCGKGGIPKELRRLGFSVVSLDQDAYRRRAGHNIGTTSPIENSSATSRLSQEALP